MRLDDVSFTMKIDYISRTTLDSERHWTPLDLGIGNIVWAPKHLRGYCGEQSSAYLPAARHGRALAKWGPSMHESSGSLSSSPRSIAHSSTAKAAPTASPIILARFPEPATEYDRSGLTNFNPVGLTSPNPVGDSGIYLLRNGGLRAPSSPIPGVGLDGLAPLAESTVLGGLVPHTESTALAGLVPLAESTVLGGLVPRTEHAAFGGLPLSSTAFTIFAHTSHVYGLTAFLPLRGDSSLVFLPPSPLPKAVPAAGRFRLPLAPFSLRFLPYPSRAARAPQKPWRQRRPSHSRLIYQGVLHRRRPPPRPPVLLCPSPPCLALQSLRRRRRADEQRQQREMHPRCKL